MIRIAHMVVATILTLVAISSVDAQEKTGSMVKNQHRPPAVPLVVHDPYFSVWSAADHLTDDWSKHWTGRAHTMASLVRIDGMSYRIMGKEPAGVPALKQQSVRVLPTRTIYEFASEVVSLRLTFLTPTLPHDIYLASRPATYVIWEAAALDGQAHDVSIYFDCSAELAVNEPSQEVTWSRLKAGDMTVLRVGTSEQPVLKKKGDDVRIDWGHFYLASAADATTLLTNAQSARDAFGTSGTLPENDSMRMPRPANDSWPVLACMYDLGQVSATTATRHTIVAYDDIWALEYLDRRLRPYWRTRHDDPASMLQEAEESFEKLNAECAAYDTKLMADLTAVGGEDFAYLAALSFRQCLAAHKIAADYDGAPLMFSKENFSNGCIGTVDVLYPASPFFLVFSPEMLKAQLRPLMDYAVSNRWRWPFAPHDLGTYPLANGQVYGAGEKSEHDQMPVEESGNMLIMLAALARQEGNVDFARAWWPVITEWAHYLRQKGFDPANQLNTDDFAGHLAHNANLSIKAILGIGAYGILCEMDGKTTDAAEWKAAAADMAGQWIKKAEDGDHYRLAFDKPGTWSQKYNLVWDSLLGLNVFPRSVTETELAYYKTRMEKYGLPLDSREKYAKLDWEMWIASMTDTREDFEFFVGPIVDFVNETPDRSPLTDWYMTLDAKRMNFSARSVVGGVFIPMLSHENLVADYHKLLQK